MPEFSPGLLESWTGGSWTARPASRLPGFAVDTRRLRTGEVFVAIRTEKRDGHDFLDAATAAGAAAAIVARANAAIPLPQLVVPDPIAAFQAIAREHRRRFPGPVVGISGSAGKTSTKDLLALLLGGGTCGVPAAGGTDDGPAPRDRAPAGRDPSVNGSSSGGRTNVAGGAPGGRVLATEGNLNNHLGVPLTLTRLDPVAHDFAVVEAGISAPGEMDALAAMIAPDVTLITLVAQAHTARLRGLDGVAEEKARLAAATRAAGVAIFSLATASYGAFRELGVRRMVIQRADVLRPSEPPKDTVFFTVSHRMDTTAIGLAYGPPPPLVFTMCRVSDGMAQNAVMALCAALWLGLSPAGIQARLASWTPAPLRGEIRRDNGRLLYLDCYNANPASMADALATFESLAPPGEARLFVIGCMEELGADSAARHRDLGRSLPLRSGDRAFLVGTHAGEIRLGALEAGVPESRVHVASSAAAVAEATRSWRGAVFVKGSRQYRLETIWEPPSETADARGPRAGARAPC